MRHLLLFIFLFVGCAFSFSQVTIDMKKNGTGNSLKNVCYKGDSVSVSFQAVGGSLNSSLVPTYKWFVEGQQVATATSGFTKKFAVGAHQIKFEWLSSNTKIDTLFVHDTLKQIDFKVHMDSINTFRYEFIASKDTLENSLTNFMLGRQETFYDYTWIFDKEGRSINAYEADTAYLFNYFDFFTGSKRVIVDLTVTLKGDQTCSTSLDSAIYITNQLATPDSIVVKRAFAPESSNRQDRFWTIKTNGETVLKVQVFNRNGQLVFERTAKTIAWDGRTPNGGDCAPGVYFYVIEPQDSNYEPRKGFFYLFRGQ